MDLVPHIVFIRHIIDMIINEIGFLQRIIIPFIEDPKMTNYLLFRGLSSGYTPMLAINMVMVMLKIDQPIRIKSTDSVFFKNGGIGVIVELYCEEDVKKC